MLVVDWNRAAARACTAAIGVPNLPAVFEQQISETCLSCNPYQLSTISPTFSNSGRVLGTICLDRARKRPQHTPTHTKDKILRSKYLKFTIVFAARGLHCTARLTGKYGNFKHRMMDSKINCFRPKLTSLGSVLTSACEWCRHS